MEFARLFLLTVTPQDRLDQLIQHFQNPTSRDVGSPIWLGFLILVGVVLAFWLVGRFFWARSRKPNRPWALFFTLCRSHRLTRSERWFLWTLARSRSPDAPARVFLDPELLSPEQLPVLLASKSEVLVGLRARLFGSLFEIAGEKGSVFQKKESPVSQEKEMILETQSAEPAAGQPLAGLGFPTTPSPSLDLPPWNHPPREVVRNASG